MNLPSTARPASHGHIFSRGLAACLAAAFVFAAPLARAQDDPVVARVNGTEIRQSDLALAEEDLGNQAAQMDAAAKHDYLVSLVSDMILVAQAAEARKVQDGADFKRRLALTRTKLLMEQFLQAEAKNAVTDAAMRKVYDEAIGQMKREPEVRARHILVETEDEAKAVVAELKKGADFAELAKSKSKDPGSADGGDLGYFTKDQMVPEFAEAAFKLDKGKISDPVKTQFGWHIIKLEDKRKKPAPTYEQVKDQLETFVARKAQSDLVAKLRGSAKIEKTAAAPAPTAPAAPAATPAPAAPTKK